MNGAHWHLILNHLPVMGVLIGTLLLSGGILTKSKPIVNAALLVIAFSSLMTIPVYLTGEPAEDIIENLGVQQEAVHSHEEAAEIAAWGVGALGLLALVTLFLHYKVKSKAGLFSAITLILGLIMIIVLFRVGNLGGMIRHTEITTSGPDIIPENSLNSKNDDE